MPQVARATSKNSDEKEVSAKAQEQEFKRARGAISCAECRRLKLKCDKTVPCSSCKRRGCASICPNGSLTTGQGTRFILADTDRLHQKITIMSDRIRQLEDALAILQSSVSRDSHPLLRRELLDIKSGLTLHSATNLKSSAPGIDDVQEEEEGTYINAFGTLAVRDDGAATFYGRSAGTESLLLDEKSEPDETVKSLHAHTPLPPNIQRLTAAFPSQSSTLGDVDFAGLVENYLPPWPRAAHLCDLYLEQSQWFFGPITRRQLTEEILPIFYSEATAASASTFASSDATASPLSSTVSAFVLPQSSTSRSKKIYSAHDLALLFVVFCFGALTDATLPPAPHNVEAEQYFQLTRASMNIEPVFDRPPSVVTVQTLSLMAIYQGLVADENSIESTWALMGLSTRLAQSVGLHRDCARWKLSPQEVQKRRALFWELFITDGWQSLATGRLSGFSLPFVDTELPGDPDQLLSEDGIALPSFPLWKARFGKEIVSRVVDCTLTVKPPKYSVILDLDRKIRDFELPKFTQEHLPENSGLNLFMSHYMPKNYREFIMLYVHRGYFAMALNDCPTDPLRSQYAPSFLAGYRSACSLLSEMREQFNKFPVQIARFWVLWTHGFSAAVMLGSVVTHGAATKTSQAALAELRLAKELFEQAAKRGGRAVKFLPAVRRLHDKAQAIFSNGFQRMDIFSARDPKEDEHDELSIFTGRTRTVATKASSKSGLRNKGSISRLRKSSSQASSSTSLPSPESISSRSAESPKSAVSESLGTDGGSPPAVPAYARSLESYGNQVHPMLVDQLKAFEGQLDAQITTAEQHYTGMVTASQPPPEPASVRTDSHPEYHSAYLTPPDTSAYQGGGYPSGQAQTAAGQASYGPESATWNVWEPPSDDCMPATHPQPAVPSRASGLAVTYPAQQLHEVPHQPPRVSMVTFSDQRDQYHTAAVYRDTEPFPNSPEHVHPPNDAGHNDLQFHHYAPIPHNTLDSPSYGYTSSSQVMQDPQVWNFNPQTAEGSFSYPQHIQHGETIPQQQLQPHAAYPQSYTSAHQHHPEQHMPLQYPPQSQAARPHSQSQSHLHSQSQSHPQTEPQVHQPQSQMSSRGHTSSSSLLPGAGVFSLAETWTSFMQQELPAPGTEMYQQSRDSQQR